MPRPMVNCSYVCLLSRKLLVAEYNELKFHHQAEKAEDSGGQERDDPVVLKLKLA